MIARTIPLLLTCTLAVPLLSQEGGFTQEELIVQSRPGPVHAELAALAGEWTVEMSTGRGDPQKGEAAIEAILDGRFVVVDFAVAGTTYRYTLGHDRRHEEYSIVVMDTTGTYFVSARGPKQDGVAVMLGTDDDPYMASLGFGVKEFVYELELGGADEFTVGLQFVDTRTEERVRMPFAKYSFRRSVR